MALSLPLPGAGFVRLFQNCACYPSPRPRSRELAKGDSASAGRIEAFINFLQNAAMRLSGRDYYGALWTAKIVLDRGIDMAGSDRGNMRCFEARSSI